MPAPGAPMGGMGFPGGEVPEEMAQMMGNVSSGSTGISSGGGAGIGGAGKPNAAQMAAAQQAMSQMGGVPGGDGKNMDAAQAAAAAQAQQASQNPPREVGTIADEMKRGVTDLFQGIKEFFKLNTWLGLNAEKMDPQQQAHAKQLHSRYQQLDQEQQMVAKRMYEERMQKKKIEEEEAARKKQMEAEQQAQSFEMPSGPQKGPVGPGSGKSKKQNTMTKLKQDRTTLNNVQGE